MPEAATVIPVLDYAPPIPEQPLIRYARAAAWTLCFILVGALLGFIFAPTTYTATGYFAVNAGSVTTHFETQKSETARILQYAPPVAAAGHSTPSRTITPADISAHLRATPVRGSRLIEITFDSNDSDLAKKVVHTVMSNYDAASPNVTIIAYPTVRADHHPIYPLCGAIVGLVVALTFLPVWRRAHQSS